MDDLIQTFARFHREVVLPDIERVVSNAVDGSERRLRDEMHAIFDALAARLDRLLEARLIEQLVPERVASSLT